MTEPQAGRVGKSPVAWRIEGPFDSSYSLALLNREIARALRELGADVALHSTEGPGDFPPSQAFLAAHPDIRSMHERSLVMGPQDADVVSRNLYPPRVGDMAARMNLLHSYAWEESSFPTEWVQQFNEHLTGISCLSSHVMKVMQDNGVRVPMSVSGCGVDHWERVQANPDYHLEGETQARSFRFLHVSSFFPRKGPDALLEAYGQAFSAQDDVSLVIKTFPNIHNRVHAQLAACRTANPDYPHVVLIQDDLADSDLKSLYQQCQVLVGPSCAEGFGLPFAEAMLSGLPVITTAWSGQLDFCRPDNAWLVDYRFEQADTHFGLIPSAWAAIDRPALAAAMQTARRTPEVERQAMARRGRELVLKEFTWAGVARRLLDFQEVLKTRVQPSAPKIAWISTWNVKCGIATYSEHLMGALDWQPTILGARDAGILKPDETSCVRCWTVGDDDPLDDLASTIDEMGLDTVVIQFNFGFFQHDHLARFVKRQKGAGRLVIAELHATIDPPQAPHKQMAKFAPALAACDRLLVHSIADLNRMKQFCPVDKLVLFPHGILDVAEPVRMPADRIPSVATYGFCLPHKGLPEVLEAIGLLRDQGDTVRLTMVNAEYPVDFSRELAASLRERIQALDLQDRVVLESRFLPDEESIALLQAADLVVFAYHPTSESASGAVRYGLACGRPTLVTHLPIFEELGGSVWRVDGHEPAQLAARIKHVLEAIRTDSPEEQQRAQRALNWRNQHKYPALSKRLSSLIEALRQEIQT